MAGMSAAKNPQEDREFMQWVVDPANKAEHTLQLGYHKT
jgi:hypothetical protein